MRFKESQFKQIELFYHLLFTKEISVLRKYDSIYFIMIIKC